MKNILVVDDEENIRIALARELRQNNFNVIRAETGFHALHRMETQTIDMLIVDLNMPVMDGISLIDEVVKLNPWIKILVLSASVTRQSLGDIMKYKDNIVDVIAKPWDHDKLIAVITNTLEF